MDALRITRVETATPEEWDRAWASSPPATWFQSRAWAETWAAWHRGGLRAIAVRIDFSDGAAACLPLCTQRGRFGGEKGTLVAPGGTAGGWIAHEGLGKAHAARLGEWLLARPGLVWRVNPFDPLALACAGERGDGGDPTWCLDLDAGFEAVHRGFRKGHRAAARRAEREGVQVTPAAGDADWDAYLRAYRASVSRWGSRARAVYPPRFFAALRARGGDAVRLWLARHAGRVVAGALVFEAPAHVVYWHGAAQREGLRLQAVHLLMRTLIENACADGASVFDFNPSGGIESVSAFKRGFGASPRPSPVLRTPARGVRAALGRWRARRRAR